jgi:histidyl-tRNA synthetase
MGDRSLTLRPEATASVVRSFIEESLGRRLPLVKLYYIGAMFRQEKPQKGRLRQFHQFGAEAIGGANPAIDAEMIALSVAILRELGLSDFTVWINSVGTPESRAKHRVQLLEYLRPRADHLPEVDQEKLDRNPLRLFDSKEPETQTLLERAPLLTAFLDDDSRRDFDELQRFLEMLGVSFAVDPKLVRGLDYYTKTAFEVKSRALGAQDSLSGGGRYDLLIEELGGDPTPAVGFAAGIERILLAMAESQVDAGLRRRLDVFIVARDDVEREAALRLANLLREQQLAVDLDYLGRSQKAQMKEANRQEARFALIVFADDIESERFLLRDLQAATQEHLSLPEILQLVKTKPT